MILTNAIDTVNTLTQPIINELKANGIQYVGRYLGAIFPSLRWKSMTNDEVELLTKNGLKVFSIYEANPTYAGYFTTQQAYASASHALQAAEALKQPYGTVIFFTVDFDAQPQDMPAIISYFDTLRKVLTGKYYVGVYGGYNTLQAIHGANIGIQYYYQTVAWQYSHGTFSPRHIYQKQVNQRGFGIVYDVNELYDDSITWNYYSAFSYPTIKVEINGKPYYDGIVKDGVTYVVWGALELFKTPFKKLNDKGLFEVNGVEVQGIVYHNTTYLPWGYLHPNIKAIPIAGGYNFIIDEPKKVSVKEEVKLSEEENKAKEETKETTVKRGRPKKTSDKGEEDK